MDATRRLLWAGLGLGAAAFALLALDDVLRGPLYQADFRLDAALTDFSPADWPMHVLGRVGSQPGAPWVTAPAVLVCIMWWWYWSQRRLAAWALAASLACGALVTVLKAAFARPLPDYVLAKFPGEGAFPSGHTMGATATLGVLVFLGAQVRVNRQSLAGKPARTTWLYATALWVWLALSTGVARVLAQSHWATDVLAGWALGTAFVCATLLAVGVPRGPSAPATEGHDEGAA
jgi:undecaprenyl-diphosphatase